MTHGSAKDDSRDNRLGGRMSQHNWATCWNTIGTRVDTCHHVTRPRHDTCQLLIRPCVSPIDLLFVHMCAISVTHQLPCYRHVGCHMDMMSFYALYLHIILYLPMIICVCKYFFTYT